jgi:TP901-1 family phage major tail protein
MATTNVVNSTLVKIRTGSGTAVAIGHLTDAQFSVNHEPRDITTKDSGGWAEFLEGLRSWEMSGSGLWAFSDTNGADDQLSDLIDRTAVPIEFGSGVTGDPKFTGTAYITSFEGGSPGQEENCTYSISLKGTGAITVGVYA